MRIDTAHSVASLVIAAVGGSACIVSTSGDSPVRPADGGPGVADGAVAQGQDAGADQDGGALAACPSAVPADGDLVLSPGDDFQAANDQNPAGTVFVVGAGVHELQRVVDPKEGNQWLAEDGAVMDGGDSLADAFSGSATDVEIRGVQIRNYVDNGIHFSGGSGVTVSCISVLDTGSGSGEANGAVRFDNMSDLTVTACHFERVSSGVLPTNCTGPIVIEHNTGLNTGRNFVQLADVSGTGIRVSYNSMDRDGSYVRPGNDDVEDWISVFAVQGDPADYAQFNYNRARGHGPSNSGSFIMLGDGGGQYQRAVGNLGITPGQVGIGLSGGHYIEAEGNLMFSESWSDSNIAFYSADYGSGGCANHRVAGNRANWLNSSGQQNDFWTAGDCTPLAEEDNTFPDADLDASAWDDWAY